MPNPEKQSLSDEEKALWYEVISYAKWYDGTPETLLKMIEFLKRQGYTLTRNVKKK